MIARLGVEEARVANLKKAETEKTPVKLNFRSSNCTSTTAPDPKAEEWAEKLMVWSR